MAHQSALRDRTDYLHRTHTIEKRGYMHTALEDVNFGYTDLEKDTLLEMWREGRSFLDMADTLQRPNIDIFVILADLDIRGLLADRPGKIWGVG